MNLWEMMLKASEERELPETLEEFERGNLEVPTLILSEYIDIKNNNGKLVRDFIKQRRQQNV